MRTIICLDDGRTYTFSTDNSYQAIKSMLYTLNLEHEDKHAKINLHNGRTWSLVHNGKTYSCVV